MPRVRSPEARKRKVEVQSEQKITEAEYASGVQALDMEFTGASSSASRAVPNNKKAKGSEKAIKDAEKRQQEEDALATMSQAQRTKAEADKKFDAFVLDVKGIGKAISRDIDKAERVLELVKGGQKKGKHEHVSKKVLNTLKAEVDNLRKENGNAVKLEAPLASLDSKKMPAGPSYLRVVLLSIADLSVRYQSAHACALPPAPGKKFEEKLASMKASQQKFKVAHDKVQNLMKL